MAMPKKDDKLTEDLFETVHRVVLKTLQMVRQNSFKMSQDGDT